MVLALIVLFLSLAVGACRPDWQEVDSQIMRSAKVYVDSRAACLAEAGDVIISEVSP